MDRSKPNDFVDCTDAFINSLYPTPHQPILNPKPTTYQRGDIVEFLIGPAQGTVGIIVVERNGNYKDSEPYCSKESIGVLALSKRHMDKWLEAIVSKMDVAMSDAFPVVRWCDNPSQLKLIMPKTSRGKTNSQNN